MDGVDSKGCGLPTNRTGLGRMQARPRVRFGVVPTRKPSAAAPISGTVEGRKGNQGLAELGELALVGV